MPYFLMYGLWAKSHLFLPDDAFYYFQIAQNMAAGLGSTFDGINQTNGYHPLWLLILVPVCFLHLGNDGFIAVNMALQCLFVAAALAFVYRSVLQSSRSRTFHGMVFLSTAMFWNFYAAKVVINGMESAIFFFFLTITLCLISIWTCRNELDISRGWIIGAGCALTVLSRLDAVFFVVAVAVGVLVYLPRRLVERVRIAFVCVGPTVAVVAVYLCVNQVLFSSAMPISGAIKRGFRSAQPSVEQIAILVLFVLAISLTTVTIGRSGAARKQSSSMALSIMAIYLILFQGDHVCNRGRFMPPVWYLGPHLLWIYLALGILYSDNTTAVSGRLRRWVLILSGSAFCGLAVTSWFVRLDSFSYRQYEVRREAAEWINRNLASDAVLAGWDVGIVGYYSDRPVINLDGLVNSVGYLGRMERGDGVGFLEEENVSHIVQYYAPSFAKFDAPGFNMDDFREALGPPVWSESYRPFNALQFIALRPQVNHELEYEIRRFSSIGKSSSGVNLAQVGPSRPSVGSEIANWKGGPWRDGN